jgi:phenylalanyl-tRNA synthetase alpha chain
VIETLEQLEREFDHALDEAGTDPAAVERLRVRFLGRKGVLTELMRGLSRLPEDRRREAGQQLNRAKQRFQERIADLQRQSREDRHERELATDASDLTLPGRRPWTGSLHPVTRTRMELERIFRDMGFTVESGPEVEDDFHNFHALNLPPDHPARDATDTFYLEGGLLLRTHTSPVQIRTMLARRPPIRMVGPGRVYRRDMDATHLPMFHQLEALVVGEAVSMADLKGTLAAVWRSFFGADMEMRLRPGYFPFVEPGCEYDARWPGTSDWIELGGAGMVHPAVFEAVGIDPERYSGFAFGLGIDRIAMLRYGIPDLRLLVENDLRFLSQFPV